MIHRPFLFRAFQSSQYAYTRQTCVSAAMTILREHEAIAQSDDLSIWTHTAFCITAAVILCFEVSYRVSCDDRNVETYRGMIRAARDRLVSRQEDVLASRGVTLIDVILLEEAAFVQALTNPSTSSTHKIIDLPRVIDKFFATNKAYMHQDLSKDLLETLPLDFGSIDGAEYLDHLPLPQGMYDFDEWFDSTFNDERVYLVD